MALIKFKNLQEKMYLFSNIQKGKNKASHLELFRRLSLKMIQDKRMEEYGRMYSAE